MEKKNATRKVSRKFIMAILGFVIGALTTYINHSSEIVQLAGILLSGISAVTYIISESRLDMKSIKVTIQSIADAKNLLESLGVDMSCLDPILNETIEKFEKGSAAISDLSKFIDGINTEQNTSAEESSEDPSEK